MEIIKHPADEAGAAPLTLKQCAGTKIECTRYNLRGRP